MAAFLAGCTAAEAEADAGCIRHSSGYCTNEYDHPACAAGLWHRAEMVLSCLVPGIKLRCQAADDSALESGCRPMLNAAGKEADACLRRLGHTGRRSCGPACSSDQYCIRTGCYLCDGLRFAAYRMGQLQQNHYPIFGAAVSEAGSQFGRRGAGVYRRGIQACASLAFPADYYIAHDAHACTLLSYGI
ncbi:hypothetical protein D3C78_807870 [compost metagenome]